MKILITGAKGFAGGYLLRYLSNIYGIENVHGTGISKARIDEGFIIKVGDLVDSEFVNSHLMILLSIVLLNHQYGDLMIPFIKQYFNWF